MRKHKFAFTNTVCTYRAETKKSQLVKKFKRKGGEIMAAVSKHHSARARFMNASDKTVQTLSRLRPNLQASTLTTIMSGINNIRGNAAGVQVTGGFYTVEEELTKQ
jgi:hypothetical protein